MTRSTLATALLAASASACSLHGTMIPVQGPLSQARPVPVVALHVDGFSRNLSFALPDGDSCKGRWSFITIGSATLLSQYGSTYIEGFPASTRSDQNPRQALAECGRGRTFQLEFVVVDIGANVDHLFGIGKDSEDNIYLFSTAPNPPESFTGLQSTLKVGQRILVTDERGIVAKGQVVSVTDNQLAIREPGGLFSREQRYVFLEDSVRRIEDGDSTWNGLLIGAGIGAGLGSLVGVRYDVDRTWMMRFIVDGMLLGAWAGTHVDNRTHRLLYVSPRGKGGSVVITSLGSGRVGLAASIRF